MSVANQKRIIIGKRVKRNKENLYAMINLDALREAMQTLKGSSLKLWLYFNKNQDKYEFELSRVDCKSWGIKKDSYYSAVTDLIETGYLVPLREGSNIYVFFESAKSENKTEAKKYRSKFQIQDWENQNDASDNKNKPSEKLERNNTYNTKIVKNNTTQKQIIFEIEKYKDVVRMCTLGFYNSPDVIATNKILQRYSHIDAIDKKIEHMTDNELFMLKHFWDQYCNNESNGGNYYE